MARGGGVEGWHGMVSVILTYSVNTDRPMEGEMERERGGGGEGGEGEEGMRVGTSSSSQNYYFSSLANLLLLFTWS